MEVTGLARGFGNTVSGVLLLQVYGIFLSQVRYKVSCYSWILGIQFIDMNYMFIFQSKRRFSQGSVLQF